MSQCSITPAVLLSFFPLKTFGVDGYVLCETPLLLIVLLYYFFPFALILLDAFAMSTT